MHFVARAGHIEGWALDKADPKRPVPLELSVDGELVARDLANLTSPNMLVAADSRLGFRIQIPNRFVDDRIHHFEVRADGVALPAVQGSFRVHIHSSAHQVDGLPHFYARFDGVGFEFLRGAVKTDARNDAWLALCAGDEVLSRTMLDQTLDQGAVDVRLKIPDALYDGKRRSLSVRVDTAEAQKVVYSVAKIMAPKRVEEARLVDFRARGGRFKGAIAIDNQWTLEGGVGLFSGGMRVAAVELSPRSGDWGEPADFDLDASALASVPWLDSPVELALIQAGAAPIDVTAQILEATSASVSAGALRLYPAVPFNGTMRVGLSTDGAGAREVTLACAGEPQLEVALQPAEAETPERLRISLNGVEISGAAATRLLRRPPSSAHVRDVVDPAAPEVARTIETIRFGGAGGVDPRRKGQASGAWELAGPNKIAGWAVDLETPARILSVSLFVDGAEAGVFPANLAHAFSAPDVSVHRGFVVDLERIDVAAGMRSVEIRFAGAEKALHPQAPVRLLFPGRSASSGRAQEIDRLVSLGRLDEAYVRTGGTGDAGVAVRRLTLDALLRPEWTCFEQSVDRLKGLLDQEQVARLKRLATIVPDGELDEFDETIGWLDLPPAYSAAFEQRPRDAQAATRPDFASAYARWIAASQPRRTLAGRDGGPARIVVLDLADETSDAGEARADGVRHVRPSAATRASIADGGTIDPAALDELRGALDGADWALVIGRPRRIPDDVHELWASVARANAVFDVTLISAGAEGLSARELDRWSAFVDARSTEALAAVVRAVTSGKAHCLQRDGADAATRGELTLLEPGTAAAAPRTAHCLCLHDFADEDALPAVPAGVETVRADWAAQGGLPTRDQILAFADRLPDGWPGGVVILSKAIAYPRTYISDCLRHFERNPIGVTFVGVNYDRDRSRVFDENYWPLDESSLALPQLGCFPLSLIAAAEATGPSGELRILDAGEPFRVERRRGFPNSDERLAIFRDLERLTPSENRSGFRSALRERYRTPFWRFQGVVAPQRLVGLDDEMRAEADVAGLGAAIAHLGRAEVEEARDLVGAFVARRDFLAPDQAAALKLALGLVKITGQQDVLAEALLARMPALVAAHPALIVELIENAAFVFGPDELAALVIGCAAQTFSAAPAARTPERAAEAPAPAGEEPEPAPSPDRRKGAMGGAMSALLALGGRADSRKARPEPAIEPADEDEPSSTEETAEAEEHAQHGAAPIAALLDVCRRFCGRKVMTVLLGMIDRSGASAALMDPECRRIVGDAFATSGGASFTLPNTGLGPDDFKAAAARDVRMIGALLGGRRAEFLLSLNETIADEGGPRSAALALRTYTNELRAFEIKGREIAYPADRGVEEVLRLALIVGDLDTASSRMAVESAGAGVQSDALSIVWRSGRNDYAPLNEALRVWYAPYGVAPLRIEGDDVEAAFASVFRDHGLPDAPSRGKVSIVCTVFNPDVALLKLSIGSMLAQTYRDIEIILVDDASDPDFARMIEDVAASDPRIRRLRTSRNAGPYHGRNRALEIGTGDFVAIHDGDDVAHPQRLEVQVGALAAEPSFEMSTTGHLRIDTRGQVQFEHTLDLLGDGTMTSMFRRSLFDLVGGFAEVRSRGDVEFRERARRALGRHVVGHAAAPLMFCLAAPASLSNHTAARHGAFLTLYREAFAKRVVRGVLDGETCGSGEATLHIPYPLRSTTPR